MKSIYKPRNIAGVSRMTLLCSELLLPITYWLFLKGPYNSAQLSFVHQGLCNNSKIESI